MREVHTEPVLQAWRGCRGPQDQQVQVQRSEREAGVRIPDEVMCRGRPEAALPSISPLNPEGDF